MNNHIKRLIRIDNEIFNISSQIFISDLFPINAEYEKQKFFKNNNYNPVFTYKPININFQKSYKKLDSLKFKNTVMDKILREKSIETRNFLKLFENIGKKDFTKYSVKLYKKPEKQLIKKSIDIIKFKPAKINKTQNKISTKIALKEFVRIFKELNIDWKIKQQVIASKAMVIPSKRMFFIKNNTNFSKTEIKRFIVHEIYTHILRTEFGLRQPYKIFSTGLGYSEATEEGLALYKEKRAGLLKKTDLKKYALRVLAIDKALKSSFSNTFKFLNKYLSNDRAWDLTLRVKRGLSETYKPGAFTKDQVYLKGFYEVNNFIKNQSCLHLLHYGKIGIHHALMIPSIEALNNPYIILKKQFKRNIHDLSILY